MAVTPSIFQLARAALDFGERRFDGLPPPAPLLALRAVLPVLAPIDPRL